MINTAGLLFLITPFSSSLLNDPSSCLHGNFYGNYRDGDSLHSIFIADEPCLTGDSWPSQSFLPSSIVGPLATNNGMDQLVWVEEQAVDALLKAESSSLLDFWAFLDRLDPSFTARMNQGVLSPADLDIELWKTVYYRTETAALISVARDTVHNLDSILPRYWKATPLPTTPVEFVPVPPSAVDPVRRILANLKYDGVIDELVNSISIPQMKNDIRFLTGEDSQSGIMSRHSFAEGSRTAAKWLKERFEDTGASCELKDFLVGFAPNVVCRYEGTSNTTELILISAHYDSRGSFGSTRAPGGDDDGSGTTALLGIARAIGRSGLKFKANVELVAFAGEEQGLYGSKAYSRELRSTNANLTLMIQADMLAYHDPSEPAQLGLPDLIGTPEVTQLVANVSAIYSPELEVGFTPACCSDHQSFHEQGFPATQVFERAGPILDPMYHNSGDLSGRSGYDFDQLKSIAKVQFATLLHSAGFELEP
ncbi:hypothetical protein Moror_13830 [Moniliophthora roreri MCA 2997]|uniref:Peptide hydrolase n=2 Tax=Moniliophthora roreri TaxID=221103 RepID=V2X7E0_MONRO|nr:hypothetical protein Moror_13830 [Moniliophthora roreri MCA 2997]KAI3616530.1 hypothetical protein WG66_011507 [Moniliophthora roreri]